MSVNKPSLFHRPFTLRVFFPNGDPNGIRIIDDNNWTGRAVCISRDDVEDEKSLKQAEFDNEPGVYLLVGEVDENVEDTEFSTQIYIGETDNLGKRLKEHAKASGGKDFWHLAIAFMSTKGALSKGHCLWLENKLIEMAKAIGTCSLNNRDNGSKAKLIASEVADCELFLEKICQILPLIGIQAFEVKETKRKIILQPKISTENDAPDTIVVPAREEGFQRVFINENCWHAIRIFKGRIDDLKYIAAYRVGKEKAITHFAEISEIVPFGDDGKYKVIFKKPASKLEKRIMFAQGIDSSLQASRYTQFSKLSTAKNLTELFDFE